jgi:prepilin-type N-terminal cleavage/methylation domain-containing protein
MSGSLAVRPGGNRIAHTCNMHINHRGATLIETLIVLSILALLISFGINNTLGYYEALKLQGEADKIAAELRLAQNKALSTGRIEASNGVQFASSGFPLPKSKGTISITNLKHKTKRVIISNIGRIRIE